MQAPELPSGSGSPDAQYDSHGGVKYVLRKVKDKAKKLKNKIRSKKAEPSDEEIESDESPVEAEHQETTTVIVDGESGYNTRDLSSDKSEAAPEAHARGAAMQDTPRRSGEKGKDDKETAPADGHFSNENLAAREEDDCKDDVPREPSEAMISQLDSRITAAAASDSLVAPAQQSPDTVDDAGAVAGEDMSKQAGNSYSSKNFRTTSENNDLARLDADTGEAMPVLAETSIGSHSVIAESEVQSPFVYRPSSVVEDKTVPDGFLRSASPTDVDDPAYHKKIVVTDKCDDAEGEDMIKDEVENVSVTAHDAATDSLVISPAHTDSKAGEERDGTDTSDSKTCGDNRDEVADEKNVVDDHLPVSDLDSTVENTDPEENAVGEKIDIEQAIGEKDIAVDINKTPDDNPSTSDEHENIEGERSFKSRACERLANEVESVAAADTHAAGALDEESFYKSGYEVENRPDEYESKSPREQRSFMQITKDRIAGVKNYFPSNNLDIKTPADEQDIGLPADEQSIPASGERIEPNIASIATETSEGLQDSLPSKPGYGASSSLAATDTGDGGCGPDEQLKESDHEQQLQLSDKQPSSPSKPTIASRAAGTVLGLKDTLASKFGYGTPSPTSAASPTYASEEDLSGNSREMHSPKSKSYMQQVQEVAAGRKDSLLSKLGYDEQKTVLKNTDGDQQAPEAVDQQPSEEIGHGKDTMAAEAGCKTDHEPTISDPVSTEHHQKTSIFDPGEEDVALSQLITDTVSGTAAALKHTLLSPFSPRSPKP